MSQPGAIWEQVEAGESAAACEPSFSTLRSLSFLLPAGPDFSCILLTVYSSYPEFASSWVALMPVSYSFSGPVILPLPQSPVCES